MHEPSLLAVRANHMVVEIERATEQLQPAVLGKDHVVARVGRACLYQRDPKMSILREPTRYNGASGAPTYYHVIEFQSHGRLQRASSS